jgi:hypothetical protein
MLLNLCYNSRGFVLHVEEFMASLTTISRKKTASPLATSRRAGTARMSKRFRDAISIAESRGLLEGGRTVTLRGRMPAALVREAKRKTGAQTDSRLLEAALANIAVADDFGEWLISQRGTINPDLDLEF